MRKRVLLTGAFGNVGRSAARELLRQGHVVRCFDLKSKANQKAADQLAGQIEVRWGDVRHLDDVQAAVMDQDVVIHLVAIIPPLSEIHPDWSRQINVGGTRNVITAMQSLAQSPKLIYTSSVALFGRDQDRPPPRTVADPIQITDHYTSHKAECEEMVRASGLRWAIFRLGAVVPIAFAAAPYHTDWMDTTESQRLLNYQRVSFEDYLRELRASLGGWQYLILLFRPLIRYWMLQQSPYYAANRKKAKQCEDVYREEDYR